MVTVNPFIWPLSANFTIPRVGPDFHEVIFPECSPPMADSIVAQQQRTVCTCLLGLIRSARFQNTECLCCQPPPLLS